jgi:hypothetical protein
MDVLTGERFQRQTAVIIFLWLLAMLVGGLVLIRYGNVLQNAFA